MFFHQTTIFTLFCLPIRFKSFNFSFKDFDLANLWIIESCQMSKQSLEILFSVEVVCLNLILLKFNFVINHIESLKNLVSIKRKENIECHEDHKNKWMAISISFEWQTMRVIFVKDSFAVLSEDVSVRVHYCSVQEVPHEHILPLLDCIQEWWFIIPSWLLIEIDDLHFVKPEDQN